MHDAAGVQECNCLADVPEAGFYLFLGQSGAPDFIQKTALFCILQHQVGVVPLLVTVVVQKPDYVGMHQFPVQPQLILGRPMDLH